MACARSTTCQDLRDGRSLVTYSATFIRILQQAALLKSNFAKYGPIFKRTIMGRTVVSIQNPEDVEIVIKADGRYPMRPKLVFKVDEEYSKSRGRPKATVLR